MRKEHIDDLETEALQTEEANVDTLDVTHSDITATVPGDFNTLDEALHGIRRVLPTGSSVNVEVQPGYEIEEQINLVGGDYSHITITSVGDIIPVSSSFPDGQDIFRCEHGARAPVLDIKIDCGGYGNNGLAVRSGAVAIMRGDGPRGVINANQDNVFVSHAGRFSAYGDDFTGAGRRGATLRTGAIADFGGSPGSDFSGAGENGIYAEYAVQLRAINATVDDTGSDAVRAARACSLAIDGISINNPGRNGLYVDSCFVDARGSNITGSSDASILASKSCNLSIEESTISGTGYVGVYSNQSRVDIGSGSVTGHGTDIRVDDGGIINCDGTETTASTGSDPHVDDLRIPPNTVQHQGIIFVETTETG